MTRRPAETAGTAAALIAATAAVAAGEPIAAVTAAVGILPAIVTYLVTHGGILGLAHALIHGARPNPDDADTIETMRILNNELEDQLEQSRLRRPDTNADNAAAEPQ